MTYSTKYHSHTMVVTIIDAKIIFYGANGLDHGLNTSIICYFDTIRKREEGL